MASKENKAVFNPNHTYANVHGMVGVDGSTTCQTRTKGVNCTGCCVPLEIKDRRFNKEEGEDCIERVTGTGCKFITEGKRGRPFTCFAYHCSGDIHKVRDLQLSKNDRDLARLRLNRDNYTSWHFEEIDKKTYDNNQNRIDSL